MASRFLEVTVEKLNEFLGSKENANTKRKTSYDVKLFKTLVRENHQDELREPIHALEPKVLTTIYNSCG